MACLIPAKRRDGPTNARLFNSLAGAGAGDPNWLCYYTDRNGKRRTKSTLTRSKREAERICAKVQSIEDQARTGNITQERARRVIEKVVGEIMAESGALIERKTVREHFTSWLKAFESEQSEGTFIRYQGIVDYFLKFLDGKASRNLSALTADDVERYRDHLQGRVAPSTVNTHLKVIRVALERAVKQRVFETNPARLVDNLSTEDHHERRAFTQAELKKLLAVCNERLDNRSRRSASTPACAWATFKHSPGPISTWNRRS